MRVSDLFLPLVLSLIGLTLEGQPVTISGSGNGYAGTALKVFRLTDPVTKLEEPIAGTSFNESGEFSLSIQVEGISTIYLRSGIFRFTLLVTPGTSYKLSLPDYTARPAGEEDNPFYSETVFIPSVTSPEGDINNLMRSFDIEYNSVFNAVAHRVFNNFRRSELPGYVERMNKVSSTGGNEAFSDFVRYRMVMLNLVANGEFQGRIEDSVIINRSFNISNPGYYDLVDQMFGGYFRNLGAGKNSDRLYKAIYSSSLPSLKAAIISEGRVSNPELVDFIIMQNLYPEFFSGTIPREIISSIIESLGKDGSSAYIRETASFLSGRLSVFTRGKQLPGFNLADVNGKTHSLASFRGKPSLLCFISTSSGATMTELSVMNMWMKSFTGKLNVIFILTDKDFSRSAASLGTDYTYAVVLDGSSSASTRFQYGIIMLPAFIVVDSEGRIVSNPAPMPSENLARLIQSVTGL
ncbi:MAG: TlpA disulfide reductase family protein [Bacteroidales bacterium]